MHKTVSEIRIYPISSFDYPTEEYAKMCIANEFENYSSFYDLGNDRAYLDLYNRTLFLFQYHAKIIAKGNMCLFRNKLGVTDYYTDEIEIFDEQITAMDIKSIWQDFKKFNSAAQKIPIKYLSAILELLNRKKKAKSLMLSENESFFLNCGEGKKIEYYVTKYERNPIYRGSSQKTIVFIG